MDNVRTFTLDTAMPFVYLVLLLSAIGDINTSFVQTQLSKKNIQIRFPDYNYTPDLQ